MPDGCRPGPVGQARRGRQFRRTASNLRRLQQRLSVGLDKPELTAHVEPVVAQYTERAPPLRVCVHHALDHAPTPATHCGAVVTRDDGTSRGYRLDLLAGDRRRRLGTGPATILELDLALAHQRPTGTDRRGHRSGQRGHPPESHRHLQHHVVLAVPHDHPTVDAPADQPAHGVDHRVDGGTGVLRLGLAHDSPRTADSLYDSSLPVTRRRAIRVSPCPPPDSTLRAVKGHLGPCPNRRPRPTPEWFTSTEPTQARPRTASPPRPAAPGLDPDRRRTTR